MTDSPITPASERSREDLAQLRHDLKTPLNHILGYSEMLEEIAAESGPKEFIPDLERIQHAARNLAALIDRVFNAAADAPGVPPLVRFHHEDDATNPQREEDEPHGALRGVTLEAIENRREDAQWQRESEVRQHQEHERNHVAGLTELAFQSRTHEGYQRRTEQ